MGVRKGSMVSFSLDENVPKSVCGHDCTRANTLLNPRNKYTFGG